MLNRALMEQMQHRYEEIQAELQQAEVYSNPERFCALNQEGAELSPVVERIGRYLACLQAIKEAKQIQEEAGADDEWQALAAEELHHLDEVRESLEEQLQEDLSPRDPDADRPFFLEIRQAAGGEESALWAMDLWQMYRRYAEEKGYQIEEVEYSPTELGGLRELTVLIKGRGAYGRLRYESGVHRIQRVPKTESQGRIHTSTATVAALPTVDEHTLVIDPKDLRVDTYRASGAGGQHVNKTSSAIRITHLPTGLVVTCQDERSQHRNREKAMMVLRARLMEAQSASQEQEIAEHRRTLVGSGERSERIRTYNMPQNRVTDHRIGLTLYRLDQILLGDLDPVINPLLQHVRQARLDEESKESLST